MPCHPSGSSVSLLLELWTVVPGLPRCEATFLGCQGPNKCGLPHPPGNWEDLAKLGLCSLQQQLAGPSVWGPLW